jgi:aminoglycoside N3'-acetyltransferase
MDWNKLLLEPRHLGVPLSASKMISEPVVCSAQTMHLYYTDTNTISKRTETRFHMTHSPRSSIGRVQDNFRAYGTFGTNRAPILCQD